jgi:predicted transposase YbfD/YdcC
MLYPKKVGTLPVEGDDREKQTNEIKIAIPLLDTIEITGKTITADALLTQREIARYLVEQRNANYVFIVKRNQKTLHDDIKVHFDNEDRAPDHKTIDGIEHGRIDTRKIWVSVDFNEYLDFPHVRQAFMIQRESYNKKSCKTSREVVYGVSSLSQKQADPAKILKINREHWTIENSCHYIIDWNYDEDRSRIRTGHGPENMTRLRRFVVGLIKGKKVKNVAQKMRQLLLNTRAVFDFLKMTINSQPQTIAC